MPLHDFQDGAGPVPAHRHALGDGWVADSALVEDDCVVSPAAQVFGKAIVTGKVIISGRAQVYGMSIVSGYAEICENAKVYGYAVVSDNAAVFGHAEVFGTARVRYRTQVFGNARLYVGDFCDSGEVTCEQKGDFSISELAKKQKAPWSF